MTARTRNSSGRGLALEISQPVPLHSALKIEIEDSILLGEAIYCRQEGDAYLIGVELDQVLHGLAELGRNLQEFEDTKETRRMR